MVTCHPSIFILMVWPCYHENYELDLLYLRKLSPRDRHQDPVHLDRIDYIESHSDL